MLDALRRVLHELVVEEKVDTTDIVILTPVAADKSALATNKNIGRFLLTTNWDVTANEIFYTTIHSFKGLESPVIILVEVEPTLRHRVQELMYIGCSRARHHLMIVHHEDIVNE